jgi:hypothetical protein
LRCCRLGLGLLLLVLLLLLLLLVLLLLLPLPLGTPHGPCCDIGWDGMGLDD